MCLLRVDHPLRRQSKLHIVKLDVTNQESIQASTTKVLRILGGRGLNTAVNLVPDTAFTLEPEGLRTTIMANVMGPALVSRYLLPAIVNLTSTLASIGRDCGPESTSYSISKAALNVLTYKQAKARQDLVLLLLDPGWVKTKMGGPGAILAPRTSVKGMLSVITKATAAHAGKFYNYQEKEIL